MPYYDYRCSKCESVFELLRKMSEADVPLTEPCPECGSTETVERLISTFAIGDPIRLGIKRPDAGWNDVLSRVKKAHPKGHWSDKKYSPTAGR